MDKNKKIEFWNNEEFREIFDETALLQLGFIFISEAIISSKTWTKP